MGQWKKIHIWEDPSRRAWVMVSSLGDGIFEVSWSFAGGLVKSEEFNSLDNAINFVSALSMSDRWSFLQDCVISVCSPNMGKPLPSHLI